MENITSEQELKQLLDEGKINEEEYQELLASLNKKPPGNDFSQVNNKYLKRNIPNLLWIALVSLALMILLKIANVSKTGPIILVDAALSAILLVGIYLGHKWAYIATIIFALLGTFAGFIKNPTYGLQIFCIDSLVLVPVLFCTNYFFPKHEKNN